MAKDPAFLFYSQDWLVGTMDLTFEEKGQYMHLLASMHQKGRLNDKTISFLVGSISDNLKSKFKIDNEGLWYNERLEFEASKRANFTESRRANGSKGGRPKKNKALAKPKQNHKDNHMHNHMGNENEDVNEVDNSKISVDKFEIPDYLNTPDFIRGVTMWADANLQKNDKPLADLEIQTAIKAIAKYAKGDIKRAYAMIASNHETVYRKMYEPKNEPKETPTKLKTPKYI
jgi:uncharacterized protein YdaU (DUF1376 family)